MSKKDDAEQKARDAEALARAKAIWKYVSEGRRTAELDWFINQQAYDNQQYLAYNTATRSLQPVKMSQRDKVRINRVRQQVRSNVSFINQRKPHVITLPGSQADDAYLRARKSKNLCDNWYDALEMNRKNKLISQDGCVQGLGWAKILWSKDALAPTVPFDMNGERRSKQYGEVMFERCDPFEVYPDPLATTKSDMRCVAHALPRTIGELKHNPDYRNTDDVTPDKKLAASPLKQTLMRQESGNAPGGGSSMDDELQTTTVIEVFWKEWVTDKWKIRVVTMTEGGILLRDDFWQMDEFPFEPYVADVTGSLLQSRGIVYNIRDINRATNQLLSQQLESARIMGRLNWLIERGANVGTITDETGQYIEYDSGRAAPTQAQPAQMPAYVNGLLGHLEGAIMDLGGAHDASIGKNLFAGASGELVQSLQAGDAGSMAMLRDNFDDFLVRCFKLMLKTAKHFGKTKRVVRSSQADEFGQYSWEELDPKEISTEDDIQVRSGSNLPFNSDARLEFFTKLWELKIINDPVALLKLMELPDISNVLGDDELDIQRELANIKGCIEGKEIPKPEPAENHGVHLSTLDKFIRGTKWPQLEAEKQQAIRGHRDIHAKMAADAAKAAAMTQYEPIRRSEQLSIQVRDMAGATPQERTDLFGHFNAKSDAYQIQRRGGLVVQNPEEAERQAQNEDIELMDGKPVAVSIGDNHMVHLQTHRQLIDDPRFQAMPADVQSAVNQHIQDHERMLTDLLPHPGMVPAGALNQDTPNQGEVQ